MTEARDITLFIDPFSHHFQGDALFDTGKLMMNGDSNALPYAYLRKWFVDRGIRVHTADRLLRGEALSTTNVYLSFGIWDNYRRLAGRRDVTLSAFFAFECPVVEPKLYRQLPIAQKYFKRIFSFSDSESLMPVVRSPLHCEQFQIPQAFESVHEEIWRRGNRKFLVMINGNKLPRLRWRELYTERLRAIEYFSRYGEIDLYGVGWDVPSYQMGRTWVPGSVCRAWRRVVHLWQHMHPEPLLQVARSVYRGPTTTKAETLGNYTFALCFENMILNGWITEKIFNCLFAGTIPIYWGAPDIELHVPPQCFVDMRKFSGYDDLRAYLKSLSESDIRAYKDSAREYLRSAQYRPFTKQAFAELVGRVVQEDTAVRLFGAEDDERRRELRA
jgi:hypothetical protein